MSQSAPPKERHRALPWFKWWFVDHRSHRVGRTLTALEDGILLRLLEEQWLKGALPEDYNRLAEIAGVSPSVIADAWVKLKKLFDPVPGAEGALVLNRRLEQERTEADAMRVKRSIAGAMGGRPRKHPRPEQPPAGQSELFSELPGGIRLPNNDLSEEPKANESKEKLTAQESRAVAEQRRPVAGANCGQCAGRGGIHAPFCPNDEAVDAYQPTASTP